MASVTHRAGRNLFALLLAVGPFVLGYFLSYLFRPVYVLELLLVALLPLSAAVAYLIINGRRNADPLNRKCAAEICQLLVSDPNVSEMDVIELFMANARYRKQARHVATMVPPLMINAGLSKDFSLSFFPMLIRAASMIPR